MSGVTIKHTPAAVEAPEHLEIEVAGRTMPVTLPDQGQMAVLINAQEFFRRKRRALEDLEPQIAALGPNPDPNDPAVAQATALADEGVRHVGRFNSVLKTLFVDPEDWDYLQDGLADRTIPWQEVADVPGRVLEARNAKEQGTPVNRQQRRAAAKTGRRAT
jgi:hypothetical protein